MHTHTEARALIASEAYLNSENCRVSPSTSWQLKAWINFQGSVFPLSQASSICLLTFSCTFYLLGSRVGYIRRADSRTHSTLALAAQLSLYHLDHARYLQMLQSWQQALPHCAGFPLGCHLFSNSLHISLAGKWKRHPDITLMKAGRRCKNALITFNDIPVGPTVAAKTNDCSISLAYSAITIYTFRC